jgi:hypothetical protein
MCGLPAKTQPLGRRLMGLGNARICRGPADAADHADDSPSDGRVVTLSALTTDVL